MILAQTLNKLKQNGNFNNSQLAAYIGVAPSTVKRILSHKASPNRDYKPSYRVVSSIAKSLKITSDELYRYRMDIQILE